MTFDHSSMSISPAVVSMITRPLVGRAMLSAEATLRFGGGVRRQIPKENS